MMTYDLLEPSDDIDESLKRLTDIFAPLYTASWVAEKAKFYGNPPYNMNVGAFAALWLNKSMRIFVAYLNEKPAGYVVGILFRPFTHQRSVFQIDDWYTPREGMEVELFNYMQEALRFMGVDEIHINVPPYKCSPTLKSSWRETRATRTLQYVRT